MNTTVEVGDIVVHEDVQKLNLNFEMHYRVLSIGLYNEEPFAVLSPLPPGSGPNVPADLSKLKIVSKGGLQ